MTKTGSRKPSLSWQQRKPRNNMIYTAEPPEGSGIGSLNRCGEKGYLIRPLLPPSTYPPTPVADLSFIPWRK